MTFLGMDPDQVATQADRGEDAERSLAALQARLTAVVQGVDWTGSDRDAFVDRWEQEIAPGLDRSALLLRARNAALREEAESQEVASSATGLEGVVEAALLAGAGPESSGTGAVGSAVTQGLYEPADGWMGRDPEWVNERLEEAEDWFRDRFHEWFGDAEHPDRPWAEIYAEDVVEELTEDGHLHPRAEVEVHGVREITGSEAPQGLDDLVLQNDETRRNIEGAEPAIEYNDIEQAQIRIQTVTGADGVERYLVHVPPTQGAPMVDGVDVFGHPTSIPDPGGTLEGWDQQGQPFGWDNNLYAMAGQENAGANAVKAAMEEAGIPPGAEVAFVGHSQGGLVAAQLADDPSFNGGTYRVTDVFSVGSPVQTYTPADPSTDVLNVQHVEAEGRRGDVVPTLDLEGSSHAHPDGNPAPNVREVTFGTPEASEGFPPPDANHRAHDSVLRSKDLTEIDPASAYYGTLRNNADDPVLAAKDERLRGRYYGEGTTMTEDVVVDVSRVPSE